MLDLHLILTLTSPKPYLSRSRSWGAECRHRGDGMYLRILLDSGVQETVRRRDVRPGTPHLIPTLVHRILTASYLTLTLPSAYPHRINASILPQTSKGLVQGSGSARIRFGTEMATGASGKLMGLAPVSATTGAIRRCLMMTPPQDLPQCLRRPRFCREKTFEKLRGDFGSATC